MKHSPRWWNVKGEKSRNCLLCNFPSLCAKEQRTTVAQRIHLTASYLTGALTKNKTSGQLHKAHTVRHCNVTHPIPGFFGSLFFCNRTSSSKVRLLSKLLHQIHFPLMSQPGTSSRAPNGYSVAWKDLFPSFLLLQHDSSISSCL